MLFLMARLHLTVSGHPEVIENTPQVDAAGTVAPLVLRVGFVGHKELLDLEGGMVVEIGD